MPQSPILMPRCTLLRRTHLLLRSSSLVSLPPTECPDTSPYQDELGDDRRGDPPSAMLGAVVHHGANTHEECDFEGSESEQLGPRGGCVGSRSSTHVRGVHN